MTHLDDMRSLVGDLEGLIMKAYLMGFSHGRSSTSAELAQDVSASVKLSIVGGTDYPDNGAGS